MFFKGETSKELNLIAARIATNRSIAGLHYPCDSIAGAGLGFALAKAFLSRLFKFGNAAIPTAKVAITHTTASGSGQTGTAFHDLSGTLADMLPKFDLTTTGALTAATQDDSAEGEAMQWLADEVIKEIGS